MGLIKDTIAQQVQSANTQRYSTGTATVESYNEVRNTATINYKDPNGEGIMRKENVPVLLSSPGVFGHTIHAGSKVSVSFSGGNSFSPVITGIIGSEYNNMSIVNSGGCILSTKAQRAEEPEEIIPMSKQWIDSENEDEYKYINQFSTKYYDYDCSEEVYNIYRKVTHYTEGEQGIISTINGSMVKINSNGDIDMFVGNNTGIRISKSDQKIYLYGLTVEMVSE